MINKIASALIAIAFMFVVGEAQTNTIGFSVNPPTLAAGTPVSVDLCASGTGISASFSHGQFMIFGLPASIGSITSLGGLTVNSTTLLPTDFSVSVSGNQVTITYVTASA